MVVYHLANKEKELHLYITPTFLSTVDSLFELKAKGLKIHKLYTMGLEGTGNPACGPSSEVFSLPQQRQLLRLRSQVSLLRLLLTH